MPTTNLSDRVGHVQAHHLPNTTVYEMFDASRDYVASVFVARQWASTCSCPQGSGAGCEHRRLIREIWPAGSQPGDSAIVYEDGVEVTNEYDLMYADFLASESRAGRSAPIEALAIDLGSSAADYSWF